MQSHPATSSADSHFHHRTLKSSPTPYSTEVVTANVRFDLCMDIVAKTPNLILVWANVTYDTQV